MLFTQSLFFFFFNHTATTEIYTLSLHDALPIFDRQRRQPLLRSAHMIGHHCNLIVQLHDLADTLDGLGRTSIEDRKSTRLNSSHSSISYAVFCLKKKKTKNHNSH